MAAESMGYEKPQAAVAMSAEKPTAADAPPSSIMIDVADNGGITVTCTHRGKGREAMMGETERTVYPDWGTARDYLDEKFGMAPDDEAAEGEEPPAPAGGEGGPTVTEGEPYGKNEPYLG